MKCYVNSLLLNKLLDGETVFIAFPLHGDMMCPGEGYTKVLLRDENYREYWGKIEVMGQPGSKLVPIKITPPVGGPGTNKWGKPLYSSWNGTDLSG